MHSLRRVCAGSVEVSKLQGIKVRGLSEGYVVENLIGALCVIDEAHSAITNCMAEAVVGHNLTTVEFRMLYVLANGVAVTPTQCSRSLNITMSTVSNIIGRLEDKGCIIRRRDLPDRRKITLEPSDLGLEIFELVQNKLCRLWERGLTDLGPRLRHMAEALAQAAEGSEGSVSRVPCWNNYFEIN